MSNSWVVNASPLILLAKVGHIDLLSILTTELAIPVSVAQEIERGPTRDPARQWLSGAGARNIVPDPAPAQPLAAWDLGMGETTVLTWAFQHSGFEAIIDDRAARKCAVVHGIAVRGTLGVILAARKRNLIPIAKPIVDDLVRSGLLIDPNLVREALALVGE